MGMPFLFTTPKLLCSKVVDGETIQTSCTEEDACQQYNSETSFASGDKTLSQEFNLYCEKKVILGFLGSLFFIGKAFFFISPDYKEYIVFKNVMFSVKMN